MLAVLVGLPAQAGSLVGFYQFDDSSNLGLDSSGNHNDLTVSGGATATTGFSGGGLALDGSSGLLSTLTGAAPSAFPLGNTDYTISAWFQTTSVGALGIIGWGAYFNTNQVNALRLSSTNDSTTNGFRHYWWGNDLDGTANTSDGLFHNVAVTFDGTTRDLYFDTVLIAQDSPGGGHNVTSENFAIGRTVGNEFFAGTLDNVAVFDYALSGQQVTDFAAAPEPGTLLLLGAGLVALGWRRKLGARGSDKV